MKIGLMICCFQTGVPPSPTIVPAGMDVGTENEYLKVQVKDLTEKLDTLKYAARSTIPIFQFHPENLQNEASWGSTEIVRIPTTQSRTRFAAGFWRIVSWNWKLLFFQSVKQKLHDEHVDLTRQLQEEKKVRRKSTWIKLSFYSSSAESRTTWLDRQQEGRDEHECRDDGNGYHRQGDGRGKGWSSAGRGWSIQLFTNH